MFCLKGKTAIVTGAAQGLGEAMCQALAQAGANIVCLDIQKDKVNETAREISQSGTKVLALVTDISNFDEVHDAVHEVIKEFGRIDILCNNAGINVGGNYPPEDLDPSYWHKTMAINLTGAFYCAQAVGKQMIQQKYGRIINTSSMSALVVNRLTNRHPLSYCVSKAGIIMLTKVLAVEWAKYNITVNAVAPTYMDTAILNPDPNIRAEMIRDIPMGRIGKPEDIQGAIVYLASEEASFVTGHILAIDGGYTSW